MEQKTKLVAGMVGTLLVVFIGIFLIMIFSYNPPEKAAVDVQSPNVTRNMPAHSTSTPVTSSQVADSKQQEASANAGVKKSESGYGPTTASGSGSRASIVITVKSSDGSSVEGLICQLETVRTQPQLSTTALYNRKTSKEGECYFHDIKPSVHYRIEFFNESDSMFHEVVDIANLAPGDIYKKELIISQKTNTQTMDCIDSDGGVNYYEKGKTSGNHEDTCFKDKNWAEGVQYDKNGLYEMYCGDQGSGIQALMKEYSCPSGCDDGACNT